MRRTLARPSRRHRIEGAAAPRPTSPVNKSLQAATIVQHSPPRLLHGSLSGLVTTGPARCTFSLRSPCGRRGTVVEPVPWFHLSVSPQVEPPGHNGHFSSHGGGSRKCRVATTIAPWLLNKEPYVSPSTNPIHRAPDRSFCPLARGYSAASLTTRNASKVSSSRMPARL